MSKIIKKNKQFYIEISDGASLSIDEIWPDGDAPESPTVDDVVNKIKKHEYNAHNFISNWGFDPQVYVEGKPVKF